jgi:hypothetical protein
MYLPGKRRPWWRTESEDEIVAESHRLTRAVIDFEFAGDDDQHPEAPYQHLVWTDRKGEGAVSGRRVASALEIAEDGGKGSQAADALRGRFRTDRDRCGSSGNRRQRSFHDVIRGLDMPRSTAMSTRWVLRLHYR